MQNSKTLAPWRRNMAFFHEPEPSDSRRADSKTTTVRSQYAGYNWQFTKQTGWALQLATQPRMADRLSATQRIPITTQLQPELAPTAHQPVPWPSNQLLRALHVNRKLEWELPALATHLRDFASDGIGMYALLRAFEAAQADEQRDAIEELLPHVVTLAMHQTGTKTLQRLIPLLQESDCGLLLERMRGNYVVLATDEHGHRVLMQALASGPLTARQNILEELCGKFQTCGLDPFGHLVLGRAVESVPGPKNDIIEILRRHLPEVATCAYGTRILQRVFSSVEYAQIKPVYDWIIEMTPQLSFDPHGNFAVQYVLDNAPMNIRDELYGQLAGRIVGMSEHKYASNVVERALERCIYRNKCLIVDEMMGGDDMAEGYDTLRSLIIDEFANYVVQIALKNMRMSKLATLLAKARYVLEQYDGESRHSGGPRHGGDGGMETSWPIFRDWKPPAVRHVQRVVSARMVGENGQKISLPGVPRKLLAARRAEGTSAEPSQEVDVDSSNAIEDNGTVEEIKVGDGVESDVKIVVQCDEEDAVEDKSGGDQISITL